MTYQLEKKKMRASSRVASDEKCVRIMAKLLLLAVVCIFGCRMEQIHTQELADARGNTLFAESFSVSPLSIAHGRFKKISRLNAGKDDDTAKALQEKAAELRKEVDAFEASKQEESDKIQNEIQEKQREKDELRLRYSAEVPILKGDGTVVMERCDFRPRMTKIPDLDDENTEAAPLSRIIAIQAPLPLGIVLGQDDVIARLRVPNFSVTPLLFDGVGLGRFTVALVALSCSSLSERASPRARSASWPEARGCAGARPARPARVSARRPSAARRSSLRRRT